MVLSLPPASQPKRFTGSEPEAHLDVQAVRVFHASAVDARAAKPVIRGKLAETTSQIGPAIVGEVGVHLSVHQREVILRSRASPDRGLQEEAFNLEAVGKRLGVARIFSAILRLARRLREGS